MSLISPSWKQAIFLAISERDQWKTVELVRQHEPEEIEKVKIAQSEAGEKQEREKKTQEAIAVEITRREASGRLLTRDREDKDLRMRESEERIAAEGL